MEYNNSIQPIQPKRIPLNASVEQNPAPVVQNNFQNQDFGPMSPILRQFLLANHRQILPVSAVNAVNGANSVENYQNNLRELLTSNKANILAIIPRIMNAKDLDGNELIQGNEESGNFVNAVDRLDEIKDLGFNTFHMLPIHPTGKTHAMGTAGSLYAPDEFVWEDGSLAIDPELVDVNPKGVAKKRISEIYKELTGQDIVKWDKNDRKLAQAEFKYFNEEAHKRNIKVMLDLPSCASVDFAKRHPEMMAKDATGKEKTPGGWQDIRMLAPFSDEQNRVLNEPVLDMHKHYVKSCTELGVDGIRADVGRAKPVEFWNVIIPYSRTLDSNFGWLAETYTHEDASPQLNMPYDRPQELLEVGFDTYYGQYHIFKDWTTNDQLYDYVKENIDMNNEIGSRYGAKSLIGSFATHDDQSPMLYGGAPWVQFTSILQSMLPQVNPYITDGVQTGDYYIFPYDHALVKNTETDNHECTVHTGRMDIFNKSRKPGGKNPEIAETIKTAFSLRDNNYNEVNKNSKTRLLMDNAQDVITKGSFIMLPTNNPEIISFARHKDGKTLLFIGNRNVNLPVGGTIEIPGLKPEQRFQNLMPQYSGEAKFQNNKNGTVTVELAPSRACVFEIDDADIEKLSKNENVLQQKFVK